MHFPGFGEQAAKWLLSERGIGGIGIDTLSLDPGRSETFPVHVAMLGGDKFQIENMKLSAMPETGCLLVAAPLRVQGAPECPTRVFAMKL